MIDFLLYNTHIFNMFKTTTQKEIQRYTKELSKMKNKELPQAVAGSLNIVATGAKNESKKILNNEFIIRNNYTLGSLRVWEAKPFSNVSKINSIYGSFSDYLPDYEFGGVTKPKSGSWVAKPTQFARKGDMKRRITGKYKINKMGDVRKPPQIKGGKRRRIAAQVSMARRQKYKGFLFIPFDRYPGIYEFKAGRLQLVRDLRRRKYRIKPNRWMSRSVNKWATQRRIEKAFLMQARKFIRL